MVPEARAHVSMALAVVLCCACGQVAATSPDAATLSDSADAAVTCTPTHAGAACIPRGSFLMARWSTGAWPELPSGKSFAAEPTQQVTLDSFEIDVHEVTNAEYYAFVQEGHPPPPERCGRLIDVSPEVAKEPISEKSGWSGGAPQAERGDQPVVCVTRSEARAFCASRGGRLPTIAEWLRAGRADAPAAPPYTWGEQPPVMGQSTTDFSKLREYMIVAQGEPGAFVLTKSISSAASGKSHWGVVGLAGNVSELLDTCSEELPSAYPAGKPLANPPSARKAACDERVLRAGSNWGSSHAYGAAALVIYDFGGRYLNDPEGAVDWAPLVNRPERPESGTSDGSGNNYRSWYLGFRCAYGR